MADLRQIMRQMRLTDEARDYYRHYKDEREAVILRQQETIRNLETKVARLVPLLNGQKGDLIDREQACDEQVQLVAEVVEKFNREQQVRQEEYESLLQKLASSEEEKRQLKTALEERDQSLMQLREEFDEQKKKYELLAAKVKQMTAYGSKGEGVSYSSKAEVISSNSWQNKAASEFSLRETVSPEERLRQLESKVDQLSGVGESVKELGDTVKQLVQYLASSPKEPPSSAESENLPQTQERGAKRATPENIALLQKFLREGKEEKPSTVSSSSASAAPQTSKFSGSRSMA